MRGIFMLVWPSLPRFLLSRLSSVLSTCDSACLFEGTASPCRKCCSARSVSQPMASWLPGLDSWSPLYNWFLVSTTCRSVCRRTVSAQLVVVTVTFEILRASGRCKVGQLEARIHRDSRYAVSSPLVKPYSRLTSPHFGLRRLRVLRQL